MFSKKTSGVIFHFCVNEKSTAPFPEMEQGFYPMWSLAWNEVQATEGSLGIGVDFLCDPR